LRSLAEDLLNKIIARQFGTAESTVKVHVKSILRKIGVANRSQAAVWAMNHGLLQGSDADAPASARPQTSPPAGPSNNLFWWERG
jgi:two-component system nitrate/nitrite response regulator NarL